MGLEGLYQGRANSSLFIQSMSIKYVYLRIHLEEKSYILLA